MIRLLDHILPHLARSVVELIHCSIDIDKILPCQLREMVAPLSASSSPPVAAIRRLALPRAEAEARASSFGQHQ